MSLCKSFFLFMYFVTISASRILVCSSILYDYTRPCETENYFLISTANIKTKTFVVGTQKNYQKHLLKIMDKIIFTILS